eukprot:Selendium_serpulae@DN10096_c0_g1_i1.p1
MEPRFNFVDLIEAFSGIEYVGFRSKAAPTDSASLSSADVKSEPQNNVEPRKKSLSHILERCQDILKHNAPGRSARPLSLVLKTFSTFSQDNHKHVASLANQASSFPEECSDVFNPPTNRSTATTLPSARSTLPCGLALYQ